MRLDHPNIVRSYKLGKYEDIYGSVHYVVMELVRGVNLFELLLMKKTLDISQAADVVMVEDGMSGASVRLSGNSSPGADDAAM